MGLCVLGYNRSTSRGCCSFMRSCDSLDQRRQQELSPGSRGCGVGMHHDGEMASTGERREADEPELGSQSQPYLLPGKDG